MRAALDVHKRTIVCASGPDDPRAGELELQEIPNTERALRRLIERLDGPAGPDPCYEAGPCGYDPYRFFTGLGVACDIVAPSLTPRAPRACVKTDRRDTKKLLVLHRTGALSFVAPPTPQQEGLRDLVRCRDDLRDARMPRSPPGLQAAVASRPPLRRQEEQDQGAPGLGRPPAPRRSERPARPALVLSQCAALSARTCASPCASASRVRPGSLGDRFSPGRGPRRRGWTPYAARRPRPGCFPARVERGFPLPGRPRSRAQRRERQRATRGPHPLRRVSPSGNVWISWVWRSPSGSSCSRWTSASGHD
jgi:hypothetical protein